MKSLSFRHLFYQLGLIGMLLGLAACGSDDGGGTSTTTGTGTTSEPADTTPPTAAIIFPTAKAFTDTPSVTVHGTASDEEGIASLTVNGVAATSDDDYATWSVTIALEMGAQPIEVDIEDASGDQFESLASTEITYTGSYLYRAEEIVLDEENNRLIVWDNRLRALLAIDIESGDIQIVSDKNSPNGDRDLRWISEMVLDSENKRVIINEGYADDLLAIDLETGAHSVIFEDQTRSYTAFDRVNNRILMMNYSESVALLDLDTNEVAVVSAPFDHIGFNIYGVAYDAANDRVVVIDRENQRVMAMSLDSGEYAVISDASTPNGNNLLVDPQMLQIDAGNNRVLTIDRGTDSIIAIDLTSGERTSIFDINSLDSGDDESYISDFVWDSVNDQIVMADTRLDSFHFVDMQGEAQTLIVQSRRDGEFSAPERLALNDRLLYVAANGENAVKVIDLDTGSVTILSDNDQPESDIEMNSTFGLALDLDNHRALVYGLRTGALIAVDLQTGAREMISASPLEPDNSYYYGFDLSFDALNNRALVSSNQYGSDYYISLDSIDLSTGIRTVLTDNETPGGLPEFAQIEGLALDPVNNRVLITEYGGYYINGTVSILAFDLTTSAVSTVSQSVESESENPFIFPADIALVMDNNQAYVTNGNEEILLVDLETGDRTMVSSFTVSNSANRFSLSSGIVHDSENNLLYVADPYAGAVFAVDLSDGQRVVLAH